MPRPRVLYIASSGVDDPLIVSQVLRYLRLLSVGLEACHLITFERKPWTAEQIQSKRDELSESGIHWHPFNSRSTVRSANTFREIAAGTRLAVSLVRQHALNIIHARSFIPGNIGLRTANRTGVKLLYDMRGLWAEEKAAKGTIKYAWIKRIAQRMENRVLNRADMLVSLTHAGKQWLQKAGIESPIAVIPCCVDTQLFDWQDQHKKDLKRMVSVGSLGPGYLPEAVFGLFATAQRMLPAIQLQLVTRSDIAPLRAVAAQAGCDLSSVEFIQATPEEVPRYLSAADAGLCFIQPSIAKVASSPTKLAEYLACGLPVAANCRGIGDLPQILEPNQVGVDVNEFNVTSYRSAVARLQHLMTGEVSRRCRELAVKEFSHREGAQRYRDIYESLVA